MKLVPKVHNKSHDWMSVWVYMLPNAKGVRKVAKLSFDLVERRFSERVGLRRLSNKYPGIEEQLVKVALVHQHDLRAVYLEVEDWE